MPWRCSRSSAERFVQKNEEWILSRFAKLPPVRSLSAYLDQEPYLSIGDHRVRVSIRRATAGRSIWLLDEKRSEGLFQIEPSMDSDAGLMKLVRKVAKHQLSERTEYLAGLHGLDFSKVSVRDQTSRWGSCSRDGTISLNWRLILMPVITRDSVILHELAHLKHMDHSVRFYKFLDQLDPNRKEGESSLNELGETLMRVGRLLA